MIRRPPRSTLFPYHDALPILRMAVCCGALAVATALRARAQDSMRDRKSTRLNSSHLVISYAVFCLKKKNERFEVAEELTQQLPNLPWTLVPIQSVDPRGARAH